MRGDYRSKTEGKRNGQRVRGLRGCIMPTSIGIVPVPSFRIQPVIFAVAELDAL